MLLVIFGAGASYDSSPDYLPPTNSGGQQNFGGPPPTTHERERWRPPLASELFNDNQDVFGDIVKTYDKLRPILPLIRRPQSGRSVEEELQSLQAEADDDPERTCQLFSVRYYLHDQLLRVTQEWLKRTNRVSNYGRLLDQIRRLTLPTETVCLVTFNYDLLLDDALLSFDYKRPANVAEQPNGHQKFKLFKPHGSVDWSRLVNVYPTSRLQPQQIIEKASQIRLSDDYVFANATEPSEMFKYGRSIVPAIAIPVQTKTEDTFEWPRIHRDYFLSLLPSVTKILIIGWQAKEAHFLKLLRENLPSGGLTQLKHLQVVAKDPTEALRIAKEFIADIGRNVFKTQLGPSEGGFSQFVRQDLVKLTFGH